MSARQFVALGTQSQAPTRKRAHNAGLLRWDALGILFDPGEGTQRQLAFAGIAASAITHICITHFHGDHCLGLAGVVQRIHLDQVAHTVHVYYPASGQRYFDRLRYASIFAEHATIVPHPVTEPGVLATGEDWTLSCLPLDHRVPTLGYRLAETDSVTFNPAALAAAGIRGPMVAQLQEAGALEVGGKAVRVADVSWPRRGQVFAYVMDTRPCPNAVELARGADLMVMESTFHSQHAAEAAEYAHATSQQAAQTALDAGAQRLALTHFSQRYEDVTPLLEEARALHADTWALDDLTVVDVPKRAKPRP